MSLLPSCRHLRIAATSTPLRSPFYIPVKTGQRIPGLGKVVYASPSPSIVTPLTRIEVVEPCSYRVEHLEHNVLLKLRYPDRTEYLIYPKPVWEQLNEKVEPLAEGNPPRSQGLLLFGPPGTGKTSFIEALAGMYGLHRVDVAPDLILSKWVGESEQRLNQRFDEALDNAPSIIVMDDAEWVAKARDMVGDRDFSPVMLNLMNILLRRIPMLKGRPVLAVTATNVRPSLIDPALLRSGRLGKPIFIPLPDYEAIYTMLKLEGVKEGEARVLAKRLAGLGANMADVVEVASTVKRGLEPRLEWIAGRGYMRPYARYTLPEDRVKAFYRLLPLDSLVGKPARLYVPTATSGVGLPPKVALAFIVSLLSSMGLPTIILADPRYMDEATSTAEVCRGALIVDSSLLSQEEARFLYNNCRSPIIFIGSPQLKCYTWLTLGLLKAKLQRDYKQALIEACQSLYDFKLTDEAKTQLTMTEDAKFLEVLEMLCIGMPGCQITRDTIAELKA